MALIPVPYMIYNPMRYNKNGAPFLVSIGKLYTEMTNNILNSRMLHASDYLSVIVFFLR